jgi:hypothetical protein
VETIVGIRVEHRARERTLGYVEERSRARRDRIGASVRLTIMRHRTEPPASPRRSVRSIAVVAFVAAVVAGTASVEVATAELSPAASRPRVRVPSSIDRTGSTNVSSALQRFIDGVPNDRTIEFPRRGTYLLGGRGITVSGRRNLTFVGRGSTLRTTGCEQSDSAFAVGLGGSSTGIGIRGFRIVGNNVEGGRYRSGCEHQHGIAIISSHRVSIANVRVERTNGDCVYVGGDRVLSSRIRMRKSSCRSIGRMGIAIVSGRDVTVERSRFDRIAIHAFDLEPNNARGGAIDVLFRRNRVGSYDRCDCHGGAFFAANGHLGAPIRRIRVRGNVVSGGTLRTIVGTATIGGGPRRSNIKVVRNRSLVRGRGPVLQFRNIDGVVISGNRQPLAGGSLASLANCRDVVYSA